VRLPAIAHNEPVSVKKFVRKRSSGFAFVIFEQTTQRLPASQLPMFPTSTCPCWQREQQQVVFALVISFPVIVFLIVMQRAFEGRLTKKNQLREALLLDRPTGGHNWIHATGAPDYQYDAAGNMTYDATASLNYSFDQENRLTGADCYTYTYDGDGNRVRKSNGNLASNGTLYRAMTPGIVAETDLAGTTKSEYIFFGGERVARRDGVNGAGGVFYYSSDHLKIASVVTDSSGVTKSESDYNPWGGELQFTNNDTNHYKFTGKERDETGLDYFGARYYSNGLGRFITPDWSVKLQPVPYAKLDDPQTLDLYGYVKNNAISKIDPGGHYECSGTRAQL
jgi:RHS repeat-associated protein